MSEILALAAALCIAVSGMLINELSGKIDLIRLARWQMTAAMVMTGLVSLAIGGWRTIGMEQLGYLAVSSLFGIIIGSTTYFGAIYAAGARLAALLFSLASPFALVMAYLFLGETVNTSQGAGVALVVTGIILAVGFKGMGAAPGKGEAIEIPWRGIAFGIVSAFCQALSTLLARPVMSAGAEPVTAMAIRAGVACLFFVLLTMVPLPALRRAYTFQARHLALVVASAFFGVGMGMTLLMAALVHGNVGIVSTLSSMTPIVILPMVWLRTGTIPPMRAWVGAALAAAGTALISLG